MAAQKCLLALMVPLCIVKTCVIPALFMKNHQIHNLKHPDIVYFGNKDNVNTAALTKELSKLSQLSRSIKLPSIQNGTSAKTVVACVSNGDDVKAMLDIVDSVNLGIGGPVVIVHNESLTMSSLFAQIRIRINQEVYFFNMKTFNLTEIYHIGGHTVQRELGHFQQRNSRFSPYFQQRNMLGSYVFVSKSQKSLIKRRSDFMGQQLIGMTEHEGPSIYLEPKFQETATFYAGNQTYDVTNQVRKGMYYELFLDLEKELNFTYRLFKRKDGIFGSVVDNKPTGSLSNLADGSADIFVGMYALISIREPYMKPLYPVANSIPGIFIKRNLDEGLSMTIFFEPFKLQVWIMLGCVAAVFGTWFFVANSFTKTKLTVPFSALLHRTGTMT